MPLDKEIKSKEGRKTGKEEIKLSLFTNNMTMQKIPKNQFLKTGINCDYRKVAEYKVNNK